MPVSDEALAFCQERLAYTFRNLDLLRSALTHASVANHRRESNERLEFLGDAVLGLVICRQLYDELPEALEGDLTKIKSAVVSRTACARAADALQLGETLALGQGMSDAADLPRSIVAAALESVIAAVYLDGGFDAASAFILRAMRRELDVALQSDHQRNFKSQLQQYAQRVMNCTPRYELLDEKGPDHAKCFEVAVAVGDQRFPAAWGPSKKEAEQKAAELALITLGEVEAETPPA